MFARDSAVRSPEPGLQMAEGAAGARHDLVGSVWTVAPGLTLVITNLVRFRLDASSITFIRRRPEPLAGGGSSTTGSGRCTSKFFDAFPGGLRPNLTGLGSSLTPLPGDS